MKILIAITLLVNLFNIVPANAIPQNQISTYIIAPTDGGTGGLEVDRHGPCWYRGVPC